MKLYTTLKKLWNKNAAKAAWSTAGLATFSLTAPFFSWYVSGGTKYDLGVIEGYEVTYETRIPTLDLFSGFSYDKMTATKGLDTLEMYDYTGETPFDITRNEKPREVSIERFIAKKFTSKGEFTRDTIHQHKDNEELHNHHQKMYAFGNERFNTFKEKGWEEKRLEYEARRKMLEDMTTSDQEILEELIEPKKQETPPLPDGPTA